MRFISLLFSAGCFFLLAFTPDLRIAWGITALFLALCLISRRQVRLLSPLLLVISVTCFSLLVPAGKVLFSVGSWDITQDALLQGLHKSAVLTGMVFISKFALAKQPHLPGSAGQLLNQTFFWFNALSQQSIRFNKKNLISSIDEKLLDLWSL